MRQAQTDSEENARLRTLLNLRQQRQDFSFESAHIIERSTSNWSSAMTLSKGTSSDVAIGDCVVNEEGYLVGVITDAGLTWSTVTTILDTDSQLGAKVFRTGEVTVAMGDLSLMQQGRLKLSYLSDESGLVNGDLLLTSGLGGYYPSGLGIGLGRGGAHGRQRPDEIRRHRPARRHEPADRGVRHHELRHRGLRGRA